MNPPIDMSGKIFGRLAVLHRTDNDPISGHARWVCQCDCGKTTVCNGALLRNGSTKSCGCLKTEFRVMVNKSRKTHGQSKKTLYKIWCGMKARCQNKNNPNYKNYGGRGINVCERWQTFENFASDVGARPTMSHSIDRIDNNSGYHCGHCEECQINGWKFNTRWATWVQQANNRRNNVSK